MHYRLDEQIGRPLCCWSPNGAEADHHGCGSAGAFLHRTVSPLIQVWTNLIGNAIKFSNPDSSIAITLRRYHDDLTVTVADRGIGMTEETRKHIFEKFYQGDSSRKEQGNGWDSPSAKSSSICAAEISMWPASLEKAVSLLFGCRLPNQKNK